MKKHSALYVISLLLLSLITSCLGDSGQKVSMGNYPGVVVKQNDSVKIHLKGNDVIYSPKVTSNVDNGNCVIVDFSLDFGQPENADSGKIKGFLTVDVTNVTLVPEPEFKTVLTDTSRMLDNEHTFASIQPRDAFILNRFFLFTQHRADVLPLTFDLSCDLEQPLADKTYDLFLRVIKKAGGASAAQPTTQYNAFDLTQLAARETDSLFFRIKYVQSFNRDSTQINWAVTPTYRFAL
jgi:hypothetical protein